jgi:hypothetical protein
MRYYTFFEKEEINTEPNNNNVTHTYATWSEKEIIKYFYKIWSKKIIEKYGQAHFKNISPKKEKCIEDFVRFFKAYPGKPFY